MPFCDAPQPSYQALSNLVEEENEIDEGEPQIVIHCVGGSIPNRFMDFVYVHTLKVALCSSDVSTQALYRQCMLFNNSQPAGHSCNIIGSGFCLIRYPNSQLAWQLCLSSPEEMSLGLVKI